MSTFETVGAVAAMAGGSVTALGWILFAVFDPTYSGRSGRHWVPLNATIMLGGATMALGVAALLAVQGDVGAVKVIGASLLIVGLLASHVVVQAVQTFSTVPRWMPAVALTALVPGSVLFLVSAATDEVFASPSTWVVVVAALVGPLISSVAPPRPGAVLEATFPLSIVWLGAVALAG